MWLLCVFFGFAFCSLEMEDLPDFPPLVSLLSDDEESNVDVTFLDKMSCVIDFNPLQE